MRLPTWDELIEEQRNILDHPFDRPLFVVGPPGSGKTVLAVRRAQMLAETRNSVALVTYNRMLRRLATLLSRDQVAAQTMHAFIWVDYRARTGSPPERSADDTYAYNWPVILNTLARHVNSGPSLNHLVVDEGQDLAQGFFYYARRHGAGVLTVFADEDQALGDRRTTLEQIQVAANLPHPIILQDNHRNAPEVAAVAEHFHSGRLPAARVRRKAIKEVPRLIYSPGLANTAQLIGRWSQARGGTIGVIVHGNDTGVDIHRQLRELLPQRRVDLYTSTQKNEDEIALLEPGVTVLNKESVKGQEFDTVFLLELERFIPCLDETMRRAMYMLCARARDNLLLVHGPGALSQQALNALPGSHLLERT